MKKNVLFLITVCFISSLVFSQDLSLNVIASQGNVDSTDDITLEWTLGEIFIKTVVGQDNIYSQGFHQPELIGARNALKTEPLVNNENILIYPNPSNHLMYIEFKIDHGSKIILNFYDLYGRFIKESKLDTNNSKLQFNISDLADGIYLLNISNAEGSLDETHRIIKS